MLLFVSAKVSQFALLPKGQVEATDRVLNINTGVFEVECPKGISLENIARMNREYMMASMKG